jgi:murein L,D-transpeptidase YcbB/YkuD
MLSAKKIAVATLFVFGSGLFHCVQAFDSPLSSAISRFMAARSLAPSDDVSPSADDELLSRYLTDKFYSARLYEPAWIYVDGQPRPTVRDLMNAILQADREGLVPGNYHLKDIQALLVLAEKGPLDAPSATKLDVFLTDAFLSYGSHLLSGRVNPYDVDNDWFAGRRTGDLPVTLEEALDSGDIRQTLNDLLPTNPVYQRLRDALARYRTIAKNGGWPRVAEGGPIKKGDRDPRVPGLRKRLIIEGDLNQKPNAKTICDSALVRALVRFQKRHGLDDDGVVGKDTLIALNVPIADRIRQLKINMERCRWLPDDLGQNYIFVNVPSYTLQVYEGDEETMAMRVVVGRKIRQTPVFSSTMTHIVLNPPWSAPVIVARKDILEHMRAEPGYLAKYGFEVYANYEDNAPLIDPAAVDWTQYNDKNLPFRFRQKPGPLNALGRIKFMMPNRFDVYLHDTPSRALFSKTVRDFSSGCIRIEKPVDLAVYLLKSDPRWPRAKIESAIAKGQELTVPLPHPIPVHLMYWTAWVDANNNVQFRADIYDRDPSLDEVINLGSSHDF